MTKKSKPPAPMVVLGPRGLMPLSQWDAEEIGALPIGAEFDLIRRDKRSHPHLRTYWKALGGVVRATGHWATSTHLHDELVLYCGFARTFVDWDTGDVRTARDSIAFDKMTQAEFNEYFKVSMAKLADHVGYDPLRFMDAAA